MKVSIGNYPSRVKSSVHTSYMNRKYGYVDWSTEPTRYENFLEKVEDTLQWVYNHTVNLILDRQQQKVKVRIDKWDTWSMDNTLAHIVVPMLKQLKETKHGAPLVDDKDVPKELRSTSAPPKENEWDVDENHFKRWDWVMGEMIWAFEQKIRDDWQDDYYRFEDDPNEQFGLKLVWEDRKGRDAHQKRMSNGFRLFGKYYEGLWD